jgi:hypothetical protein
MSLEKRISHLAITGEENGEPIYVSPVRPSQPVYTPLERQLVLMRETGEIMTEAMQEMSEIERRASYLSGVTAAIRDHHAKLAELRGASQAERDANQARFQNYLQRLGQLAELGNKALIVEAGRATDVMNQNTAGETLGTAAARLGDVFILGRPPSRR